MGGEGEQHEETHPPARGESDVRVFAAPAVRAAAVPAAFGRGVQAVWGVVPVHDDPRSSNGGERLLRRFDHKGYPDGPDRGWRRWFRENRSRHAGDFQGLRGRRAGVRVGAHDGACEAARGDDWGAVRALRRGCRVDDTERQGKRKEITQRLME